LNTPNALSEMYNVIKEANVALRRSQNNEENIGKLYNTLMLMLEVLGLDLGVKELSEEDIKLLKDYENARLNKDFAKSDELRNLLQARGIL
ncbi:MAG: DALR domain-containing protein, partial [Bacilli bacterium]